MSPIDPANPAGTRFPTTGRLLEGYDIDEVDAFVTRCERALSTRDGSVTSTTLSEARFTPVRLRPGYRMDPVDAHLAVLAERFADLERHQLPAPAPTGGGHCAGCRCVELGLA